MSYFNNKEVVVTGGAGFLSTHFITELSKLGANITTHTYNSPLQVSEEIQNDITILENIDLNNLDDAVRLTNGADLVIHCAGHVLHLVRYELIYKVHLETLLYLEMYLKHV